MLEHKQEFHQEALFTKELKHWSAQSEALLELGQVQMTSMSLQICVVVCFLIYDIIPTASGRTFANQKLWLDETP